MQLEGKSAAFSSQRLGDRLLRGHWPITIVLMPDPDTNSLLNAICDGDQNAAEELLPLLYDQLRRMATKKLASAPPQTLQATALVHEAYLRLIGGNQPQDWKGRKYFFAAAAEAMRRILVERARHKNTLKRGGQFQRQAIQEGDLLAPHGQSPEETLAVHEALDDLAKVDAEAAQLVTLRYFAGLTIPEVAEALGISARKVNDDWAYAKAWLFDRLGEEI